MGVMPNQRFLYLMERLTIRQIRVMRRVRVMGIVADNTDCRNCVCSCTLVGEVIQCYFYAGDGDKNSHGVFTINVYYQPS